MKFLIVEIDQDGSGLREVPYRVTASNARAALRKYAKHTGIEEMADDEGLEEFLDSYDEAESCLEHDLATLYVYNDTEIINLK